jgi:hypothetical protein
MDLHCLIKDDKNVKHHPIVYYERDYRQLPRIGVDNPLRVFALCHLRPLDDENGAVELVMINRSRNRILNLPVLLRSVQQPCGIVPI